MDYKEKYKEALERCKSWVKGEHPECFCEAQKAAEFIFPELKESEDERIRKEMISWLKGFIGEEEGYGYTEDEIRERIAWLEKQGECVIDCHQNHQDSNRPSGGIVLEDFNGGEGFYKLNLAYLNKKQVEEVEEMVREWNNEPTASEEDIKDCIGLCLTDADEQRFKNYHTNLRDCLAWLEKQGELQLYKGNADTMRKNLIKAFKSVCGNYCGGLDVKDILYFLESKDAIELEKQCEQKSAGKIEQKFKVGDWVTDGEYTWKITDIRRLDYILQSQSGDTVDDTIFYVDEQFYLWTIQDAKDGDVLVNNNDIFVFDGILKEKQFPFAYCGIIDGEFGIYDRKSPFTHNVNIYPSTKEQRDLLFQKMKEAGYEWDAEKKELRKIDDYCQENCKGFQETGKCFADGECKAKRESEQNPVWSEEDKDAISMAIEALEDLYDENCPTDSFIGHNLSFAEAAERLKALKPQSHWKPTDEQLMALRDAIDNNEMESLYNDLKKL